MTFLAGIIYHGDNRSKLATKKFFSTLCEEIELKLDHPNPQVEPILRSLNECTHYSGPLPALTPLLQGNPSLLQIKVGELPLAAWLGKEGLTHTLKWLALQLGPQATNSLLNQRTADNLGIADYALRGGHKKLLKWLLQQDPTLVPNRAAAAQSPQPANAVPAQQYTAPVPNNNNNRTYASAIAPQKPIIQLPAAAFGSDKWTRYFGEVGAEPPLPPNIAEILASPCPIWPGKRVGETHKLVLVPGTVNGAPLTLDLLGELIKRPRQGEATQYRDYDESVKKEHGKSSCRSHWILMTKDMLPRSGGKSYVEQKAMVTCLVGEYQVPTLLEAAACILMEHVETGRRLFPNDPYSFTRCQEVVSSYQTCIGGFAAGGLSLLLATCVGVSIIRLPNGDILTLMKV